MIHRYTPIPPTHPTNVAIYKLYIVLPTCRFIQIHTPTRHQSSEKKTKERKRRPKDKERRERRQRERRKKTKRAECVRMALVKEEKLTGS